MIETKTEGDLPMSRAEKISMKTFWEAVEQRLAACSADELRAILRAMARETPPTGRQIFLEKLKPVEETTIAAQQAMQQEDLLADLDDFTQELKASMKEADYWEERYEWGEYYDDEDKQIEQSNYTPPNVYGFGHLAYYHNVLDVLKGKQEPNTDGRSGRKSLELILAIYKSSQTGKKIALPMNI